MIWEQKYIKEIAQIVNEPVTPFEGERYYVATGNLQESKIEELEKVTYNSRPSRANLTAKKGDVILARMQGTKKVLVIDEICENYIFSTGFIVLRPSGTIDNNYLFHFFNWNVFQSEKDKLCTGATQKAINNDNFNKLKIPLPPLSHQRQIVEILDTADSLNKKNQELLKKYDTLLESTFINMFGNPVRNPLGFKKEKFEAIGKSRLGKMLDAKKQTGEKKYKYLGNSNVQWGTFKFDDLLEMEFSDKERTELELKEDDLLICEGGEVGRTAIWKSELSNCYFQKALHRVRLNREIANPYYIQSLMWFFSKYDGFKDVVTVATIPHLTGAKLREMEIPLPPINLQDIFGAIAGSIENQKKEAKTTHMRGEKLLLSLMSKFFEKQNAEESV